jgi:hypothetical protein
MALASNANPDLVRIIMQNMTPNTAQAMAEGLNQGAASSNNFLEQLLINLDAVTGQAIGQGLNAMAVGGASSPLYATLINTQDHTATALAGALNANQPFLEALVESLDGAALGEALNYGLDSAPSFFLRNDLFATDADMMARVTNSAGGINMTNNLVANLDGALVGLALNSGALPLLTSLIGGLDGHQTAAILSGTGPLDLGHGLQMMLDNLNTLGLDAEMAEAINNSLSAYPGTNLLGNLGMRARMILDFFGMTDEWGWAYTNFAATGKI